MGKSNTSLTRILLDYAEHKITWCNVNYASLCYVSLKRTTTLS